MYSVHRCVAHTLAAALLALAAPTLAEPQSLRPGLLAGRVLDGAGEPVANAVLRATQGARTVLAYSEQDGDFRLGGLGAGTWTVSIRRLGIAPALFDVVLPDAGLRRDFVVQLTSKALDPVLVAAKWTGIRGVVGDARWLSPLGGATVRVMGGDASVGTDMEGNFAMPLPSGRDFLLRIERAGYETRLVSATVPAEGYVEIDVGMDTARKTQKDYWVWRDLDQRLKYATPRAALVYREEIEATDAINLVDALRSAPTVAQMNLGFTVGGCLYVNGVARPGYPVASIMAGDVEFVELYPPGTDLTRTLALKWPPRSTCGSGVSTVSGTRNSQTVQFVSVWLKAP
ncbi:MAG: carboxypeptidase regulatory-like domain-containing protein [Gemmatimonadaceae bacterium]